LVSVGSPPSPFAQNKQNEPTVAIDAHTRSVVVAGSNDEIDLEACNAGNPTTCLFTQGVGTTGVYFSFDGGQTWTQPTYTGWTARDCLGPAPCTPHVGPIGTLPKYFENGLVSDGDPSAAFGPRRGQNGKFSWSNGSRLYFANLTSNFSSQRSEFGFKGFEAIAVSRTDDPQAAAAGDASAWMKPVIASKQNSALFSDHEQIWADNAQSSPAFGNVYVCYAAFRSQEKHGLPEPIILARSTDGGTTWTQRQLSAATNNNQTGGRQDCWIRTNSKGVVYVFWDGNVNKQPAVLQARSFDGGQTFTRPELISLFTPAGLTDPVTGDTVFDGVAGNRDGTFPTADIANGAPTGAGATDEVAVTWTEGPTPTDQNPGPNEKLRIAFSTTGGSSYQFVDNSAESTDRPDYGAIAISPNGSTLYQSYLAFDQPWQTSTANPRAMEGVIRSAAVGGDGTPGAFVTVHRGASGDARASSANALTGEFLGDYDYAAATNSHLVAVWIDVRNAADCPAIDAYRQSLVEGNPIPKPAPNTDCPATFGNSDIFGGQF
ncbi:MAG TPA: sialidase family protein, partial [Actinomycetota bacterium]|nr:sialidase family protein [Actinomycetota bacterium]